MVSHTIDTSPFQDFDESSRIWIFQTVEPLSSEHLHLIRQEFDRFLSNWTAHQQSLKAAFNLYFDHFLVVSVDALGNHATGCSLDSLHQQVASVGTKTGKDFFNRLHIPVLLENEVVFLTKKELRSKLAEGALLPDSLILDQTIQRMADWKNNWITPLASSWIRTIIPVAS